MAAVSYNVFSPYRDFCMKNIMMACSEKKWSIAEKLANEYTDYCDKYLQEILDFEFNKCGSCLRKKNLLVKLEWPEAEKYPFHGLLACRNYTCKYYLIINADNYRFLALHKENGEN